MAKTFEKFEGQLVLDAPSDTPEKFPHELGEFEKYNAQGRKINLIRGPKSFVKS